MTCCNKPKDSPTLVLHFYNGEDEFSASFNPKEDIRTLIVKVNQYLNLAARLASDTQVVNTNLNCAAAVVGMYKKGRFDYTEDQFPPIAF